MDPSWTTPYSRYFVKKVSKLAQLRDAPCFVILDTKGAIAARGGGLTPFFFRLATERFLDEKKVYGRVGRCSHGSDRVDDDRRGLGKGRGLQGHRSARCGSRGYRLRGRQQDLRPHREGRNPQGCLSAEGPAG